MSSMTLLSIEIYNMYKPAFRVGNIGTRVSLERYNCRIFVSHMYCHVLLFDINF